MAKKKKGAVTPPPIPTQSDRGSDALSPKDVKKLRTEMSGNKVQLEQTQALAEKFRLEARKASAELESQLNKVSDLESEIKVLSQENSLLREMSSENLDKTLVAKLASASDQLQRCNASWRASQKRVVELESQLKTLSKGLAEKSSALAKAEAELEALLAGNSETDLDEVGKLRFTNQRFATEVANLKKDLLQTRESLENDFVVVSQERDDILSQLAGITAELEEVQQQLKTERSEHEKSVADLNDQYLALEAERDADREKAISFQDRVSGLEEELSVGNQLREELESQLETARSLNQASLASARESDEAETSAKARIGQLESQLSEVNHTLAGVVDELETARRALIEEVAKSQSLQAQLESAEGELQHLQGEIAKQAEQLQVARGLAKKKGEQGNPVLLAKIQELESQLANLNEAFSDHMASCRDDQFPSLLARCNAAEDKVIQLREELRKTKNAAAAAVAEEEFMKKTTLPQAPPVEKAPPAPRGSRGWIVAVVIGILILITMAFFAGRSVLPTYMDGEDRGIHLLEKGMDLKQCCKTEASKAEVGQPARPTKTKTQPPRTRVRGTKKRVKAPRQHENAGQPVGSLSPLGFPAEEDDHFSGDVMSPDEFFTSSTPSGSNSPTEFGNDPELGLSAPADVAPRAVTVTPRTKKCKGGCLRKKAIRECMKLGHTRAECRSVIS